MALHVRRSYYNPFLGRPAESTEPLTGVRTEEIYKTSRLVSNLTGMAVQPNKAIVGANAFAHESGIHQDGVLKNRLTYEIIDARTIGLADNRISLGKLSGRSAFRARLEELGYTLERELGGGGMSRVFVAQEHALGREVVVKVLSPERTAALSAERFTREIKLAAALQDPHIVPVLVAGTTSEGLPYYTMPFVRGDSLRARLVAGPVPVAEALGILRNIAQALAYAHERGIVHRDIKPENVLLSRGTAVVTDFGIAKALSASTTKVEGNTLTSLGTSIGTPAYMAPEQVEGRATGPATDIYALGVVLYELATGRRPFQGKSIGETISSILRDAPRPVTEARQDAPRREPRRQ